MLDLIGLLYFSPTCESWGRKKKKKKKNIQKSKSQNLLCEERNLTLISGFGSDHATRILWSSWNWVRFLKAAAERWRGGARIAATMGTTLGLVRIAAWSSLESDWLMVLSGRVLVWGILATMPDPDRVHCKAGRTIRLLRARLPTMALRPTAMRRRISFLALLRVAVRGRKVWEFTL